MQQTSIFRHWLKVVENETTLTPPEIEIGDLLLIGKFKNRKAKVTGFTQDDHKQPVLKTTKGNTALFKPRIAKLDKKSDS